MEHCDQIAKALIFEVEMHLRGARRDGRVCIGRWNRAGTESFRAHRSIESRVTRNGRRASKRTLAAKKLLAAASKFQRCPRCDLDASEAANLPEALQSNLLARGISTVSNA